MVDLEVLEQMGSSQDRLQEIFTAAPPPTEAERAMMSEDEVKRCEENIKLRDRFEKDIQQQFAQGISYSLRNYQMYSAMDLAWDACPINKETYPLMLYAQGKLDLGKCAKMLSNLPCVDKYTTKDSQGNITAINLPQFFEVNFNLVRSVISRRLAAQANKYNALYPHYKYEPRSTTLVGKLRADVVSQVMDIMTDAFDLRHHDIQVLRDAMLYGHCVDFIRSRWEREEQTIMDPDINPELRDRKNPKLKTVITKEGVGWVNPHPSRIGWDNAYPLSSINSDTGCQFLWFWDVVRYGDVLFNPRYWNRKTISYSATIVQLFSTYAAYFSEFCTLVPPCDIGTIDLSSQNDRLNNLGLYSQSMPDSSLILGNYFRKIKPKEWGVGDYTYPVWLRMVVAGDKTVMYAEFLPSSPAAYDGINENDSRQVNISLGMELMPYQDQMTQLLSLLLLTIQSCNLKVLCIDIDSASPEAVTNFRDSVRGKNRFGSYHVFEYSGTKMRDMGIDVRKIIELVQTEPTAAINHIFQAMTQLVSLSERLLALSPHELGQPAPREISATETTMMAGTTETVYGFISDAHDEFRNAKKRILYESHISCGSPNIKVPVLTRYTRKTIEKAGFQVLDEDYEPIVDPTVPALYTVIGTKNKLVYDYIFTSRDGSLRAVNTQAANALVQLLGVLMNPIVVQKLKPEKLYEIMNEIFRLSGAGVDLNLELEEGEENTMGPNKEQQLQEVLGQLTQNAEQERAVVARQDGAVQQLAAKVESLVEMMKELTAKVEEIDRRPDSVDPMKFLMGRQQLSQGRQKMRHAEEKHAIDLGLKVLKASNEPGNGRSAYAR